MIRPLLLGFLLLGACGKPAAPSIQVNDAWARATAPGQTSAAVYATIVNEGGAGDRLVAVSSDRAAHAMLHEGSVENGIARMRMVDQIELAPGERVELKPGGGHVMLTGVAKPLNPGDRFTLRLSFEKSGEKTVPVTVVGAGDR
jgi:copper(I)-binding protein